MIDSYLMQPWAGLPIALLILVAGAATIRLTSQTLFRVLGVLLAITGVVLAGGAATAWARGMHNIDAPGKLVPVGDHRLHVLCEGPVNGPTLVWLPGGYGQGLHSYRNHTDVSTAVRSCIVDRGHLGWSDPGPWDFSPETVAGELMTALDGAGEKGPYLIAGHSYGGFYAINIAALHPDDVVGIALLDPTAPAWIDFFAYDSCGEGKPPALYQFASLFGLVWIKSLNPLLHDEELKANMGDFWPAFIAQELRPRTFFAQAAALDSACRDFLSFVREPGALGELPILLITQSPLDTQENDTLAPKDGFRLKNYQAFRENIDRSVLDLSSVTRYLHAPRGAGHLFTTSEPEFTRDQVLGFHRSLNESF